MKKITKVLVIILLLFALVACNKQEVKPETISIIGKLEEYYGKGVDIDLNNISIAITFTNDEIKEYSLLSKEVEHDDFDTSEVGKKVINITCLGLKTTLEYEVVEYTLTLNFGDGKFEDSTSKSFIADNNLIDINEIIPVPNDVTKEFAGWFYDKELTERAESIIENTYLINKNTTFYAGYDICYNDIFEYTITENDEVVLDSYNLFSDMTSSELIIPITIKLYPVVAINDGFIDSSMAPYVWWLEKVSFPQNSKVRTIGKNSFSNLPITSLELSECLERIDKEAFSGIQIVNLVLPKSIKYIGENAFNGCAFLTSVDFNDSDLLTIGNYAFSNCYNLRSIELSNKVETIGSYAFSDCNDLYSVYISKSVISIGLGVFAGLPNLINIDVDVENKNFSSIDGNLFSKNKKIFYRYCYGKNEERYELPSSVEVLFESCFDIRNEISKLNEVVLNNGLIEISAGAFRNTSLEFVIPSTVERIAFGAFSEWQGSEFKVDENNKNFKVLNKCLVSYDGTMLYSVPNGITDQQLIIPDSIKEIKSYSIGSCPSIKTIIIDENSQLNMINEYGFNPFYMNNLIAIVIKKEIPFFIADNAFNNESSSVTNDSFAVIINGEFIDDYKLKWANYDSFIDRDILSYMIDPINYYERILGEISDLPYITSVDSYYKYNHMLIKDDTSLRLIILKKIESLENLTMLFGTIDSQKEYVTSFYQKWVEQQIEYFLNADNAELTNSVYSYEKFKDVYLNIPEEVKTQFDKFALLEKQINALDDKYSELKGKRNEVFNKMLNFELSKDSFDNEAYEQILKEYREYAVYNMHMTNNQNLKIFALDCSYKMYKLLHTEFNYDNYIELNDMFYGNEVSQIYGVQQYLFYYLDQPIYYENIYQIDKVNEIEEKLNSLKSDLIEYINTFYINYTHPTTYIKTDCERDLNVFLNSGLSSLEINDVAMTCYQELLARKILNEFIEIANSGINKTTIYDLTIKSDLLSYYLSDLTISKFISNLEEYDTFESLQTNYNECFNEIIDNFVNMFNEITSDNILTTFETINKEYEEIKDFYNLIILNIGEYALNISNLMEIINCVYMIQTIISNPITEDNYEIIFALINGDIEDGIETILNRQMHMYYFADVFNLFISDEDYSTYLDIKNNF